MDATPPPELANHEERIARLENAMKVARGAGKDQRTHGRPTPPDGRPSGRNSSRADCTFGPKLTEATVVIVMARETQLRADFIRLDPKIDRVATELRQQLHEEKLLPQPPPENEKTLPDQ